MTSQCTTAPIVEPGAHAHLTPISSSLMTKVPHDEIPANRSDTISHCNQSPGILLGIIGQNPGVSKSNRLHVVIFQFFFYDTGAYSIDSSKMMGNFPEVLDFNRLFLKLNRFICN